MILDLEGLVSLAVALVAGVAGREFVGRYLATRQQHRQKIDLEETEQQRSLVEAVIGMVQQQSTAILELLRESLATNQIMATNLDRVVQTIEGEGRDSSNRFAFMRAELTRGFDMMDLTNQRLQEYNDVVLALLHQAGGSVEVSPSRIAFNERRGGTSSET